ncbi:Alw26I/Eco31I/Esp3I family type II restriction endonuclease [Staphylococcus simulans]|uniref:Alw26I/Eco31I/Esp3I family type II restriction endonuclease n=1 Tax=Staphylococcus simulans TaxID=1286 RepID=UPI000D1E2A69|nr:Alw26I/Eco31I/Esp3I family type II restriction endonuclease [Staphylococcus simulans]PTJ15030.1 Alw26I/Eco31I/Esp3I family type II restriction endonuclease [Staphylococcus simulans]
MTKEWHDNFLKYMDFIVNHKNYEGLPIRKNKNGKWGWLAGKKTEIGKERLKWAYKLAEKKNINIEAGSLAKIMLDIHPTKRKVCQICGESMSLYYVYPNKNFINKLVKNFNYVPDTFDTIYDVIDKIKKYGFSDECIKKFLKSSFSLDDSSKEQNFDEIITECEKVCRLGNKNSLGPGSMSNFPDRFDGFHSYNRCCRQKEDKGRSAENMRTYNKDRRAYENWSDGNIHAANKFMNSLKFKNLSADHIGPISLGFKHDPVFLQPMTRSQNSAKRDRLQLEDINKLIEIEEKTNSTAISWFAFDIWEFIKELYSKGQLDTERAQKQLKINMALYMELLESIYKDDSINGKEFLEENLIKPKKNYFDYDYTFDENGNILSTLERKYTDATKKEYNRFVTISFNSIIDFRNKKNRNIKISIPENLKLKIGKIKEKIKVNNDKSFDCFIKIQKEIQHYILQTY